MLRRVRLPALVAAATLLAGCFQVDSVLTVRPDGSAELTETVTSGGLLGYMLHKSAREILPGDDRSATHGDGVTVRSVDVATAPGRATITTVYAVPNVSALRYDPASSVDPGAMVDEAMLVDGDVAPPSGLDGHEPDAEVPAESAEAFRFAFEAGAGGAPARLTVTVPPPSGVPGVEDIDAIDGEFGDGDDPLEEMLVVLGDARVRFAVRAEGVVDASAGWADSDTVTLADIDMGAFVTHLLETGAGAAAFEALDTADGVALPGYRVAPSGAATIRFR